MGVLCRKWHKTTLQKDKGVLGRGENWQFVFRKQLSVNKGNFLIPEEHGWWWPSASLYPSFPCLSYKEISTDVCCVGLLGVQREWEVGVSGLVCVSFFTNWIWGWERQRFLQDALGTPGAQKSRRCAWHPLPRAFFASEGARWCLQWLLAVNYLLLFPSLLSCWGLRVIAF